MESKTKVCVVDDHHESAALLCEGLRLNDFEAIEVHSGPEALEVCAQQRIDLVLLDIAMPGMDGYEVCRELRGSPNTSDIPVIFVTVKGESRDIAQGYALGAVDYITKPYNLPIVMVRVEAALRNRQINGRLRSEDQDPYLDMAYTDQLTGLRNRRYLMERLQEEVDKAHRYDYPVSCLILDVDEVVAVDEESGPVALDDLLAEVALALRSKSRTFDVLARYDGTLFSALLPHTPLDDAIGYGEKIIDEVDATTFSDPNFPTKVGLSIGVVTCQNGNSLGAEWVLGEAMRSLLQAKGLAEPRIRGRDLSKAADGS